MNMVVKSAEVECRGPLTKSGIRQPPIRVYMDVLTITTTSVPGSRWILQGLERVITWARMSFKPSKSRSMVLKKGKVVDKFHFSVSGTVIPTITEQPVKSLGSSLTPAWKTLPPSRTPTKNLELGSPRLTSPVYLVDLKPGSTSIYPAPSLVAHADLCSPNDNSWVPRKEDQWLSSEVARPSPQLPALHCMGLVTSCSCPSVASQKNLRWYAPEKPYSTGTPGTARCHQPALR